MTGIEKTKAAGPVRDSQPGLSYIKASKSLALATGDSAESETMDAICRALECPPGDLFEYVED